MMKRICLALGLLLPAASLALPVSTHAADDSAFAAFGGKPGLDNVVDNLVARAVADPKIGAFFKDSDQKRLRQMLAEQFCAELSGGCRYTGQTMRQSHARFEIKREHFNRLVELLQDAMDAQKVPTWAQNKLLARLAPMYRDIEGNAARTGLPVNKPQ